jgi:hypothetical protein
MAQKNAIKKIISIKYGYGMMRTSSADIVVESKVSVLAGRVQAQFLAIDHCQL